MKFYKKLKELRVANNETQQELAEHLNLSFQSISKWENNQCMPNIEILIEIAKPLLASVSKALIKFVKYSKELAQKHYTEHFRGSYENAKGFYIKLEDYITSGRAYGMVVEGGNKRRND